MQLGTFPNLAVSISNLMMARRPTSEEEEDADALQTDRSALKKRRAIAESAGELERLPVVPWASTMVDCPCRGQYCGQPRPGYHQEQCCPCWLCSSRTDLASTRTPLLVHQQTVAADEKAKLEGAAGHVADMVVEPSSPQLSSPVRANEITHCTSPSLGVGSGREWASASAVQAAARANAAFRGGRGGHGGCRSEVGSSAVDNDVPFNCAA